MVRAWYMDNNDADQRLEHHKEPPKFLSLEDLFKSTGVEYFKIDCKDYKNDNTLTQLKKERGYTYEDEITCSEKCLPNYEEKLKNFFTEHLHTDEEIRFVLEGSGYFDVRDKDDQWIRIEVIAGDLIIIPSGIYHRFTLDINNYIKAKRYFVGEPVWLPYNRPADDMECRKNYLNRLNNDFQIITA
ncbi:PREDICTED: 1,2-dihydroxy-3-keto-5-methylthiopentene dioxygenase [Dufourea novaeangliae]|uniref:Acireductone dioxygenase n=1 Tax=Dufourea novaeangliae TaxID=178035 RepID=A0A154PF83_DUFNO|nr:PREDICTED: 1,2-dihydroxy-3-keto-5-methylthiopentene dioxygenase [Dufourea novaeangliae]KZC10546.1 1,2-dihydroxy-3-keto-5-methylthiopentene dioxygenase [Dufourea novaeangliae]